MKRLSDVVQEAGLSVRQAQHWIAKGWIPGTPERVGSGHYRYLTDDQVFHLAVMADLVRMGVAPAKASVLADQVVSSGETTVVKGHVATVHIVA